jgi:Tol biopolymer transport system component
VTSAAPTRIGPYEIIREIGRGGMGVVYLGRDTKLDRDVAIKCLPDELAEDADRLARFEREAKTLAALNHPNIASIHGLEELDGRQYLILEHVPGETLDERLRRGPMPTEEAVAVAIQVAAGTEAAHEKGIIHRDLKPANIKFVDRESVKVLDFGLAKAVPARATAGRDGQDATTVAASTVSTPGAVLGTPGYLSPEQARGHDVDTRSDVFAFGCILYEMLTGEIAFAGSTVSDSIASLLEKEPDWSSLPSNLPGSLRRLLRRCLAKDCRRRLQAIGDARLELEEIADPGAVEAEPSAAPGGRSVGAWVPWTVAGLLLITVIALVLERQRMGAPAPERLTRTELALPAGVSLGWQATSTTSLSAVGQSRLIAMSRDGTRLACTARAGGGGSSLYLKDPSAHELAPITGTLNARGPFFAPDGASIGFLQDGVLRTIRLPDGPPQDVCRVVSTAFDATWTADGEIIYAVDDGLWHVPEDGRGEPERLTVLDEGGSEVRGRFPHVSHDGQWLFLTIVAEDGMQAAIVSRRSDDRALKVVLKDASDVRDVRGGALVFARGGTVFSATLGSNGTAERITDTAEVHTTPGYAGAVLTHFATSDTAKLAFLPAGERLEEDSLVWAEPGKEPITIATETRARRWMHPRLSPAPDETRVLLDIHDPDGTRDLFIYDLDRGQLRQLTSRGSCFNAEWSPGDGGRSIAYCAAGPEGRAVFSITTDFMNVEQPILPSQRGQWSHLSEWTRDGSLLFWDRRRGGTWQLPADGSGELTELMNTEANERWGVVSPDGRFIAYVADEQEVMHVFVRSLSLLGGAIQVSTQGGGEPLWSHDGGTLYFRHEDAVYAASFRSVPHDQGGPLDPSREDPGRRPLGCAAQIRRRVVIGVTCRVVVRL